MVVPRRTKKQPQQSLPQASRSTKYESILLLNGSPASPTDNKRMESGVKKSNIWISEEDTGRGVGGRQAVEGFHFRQTSRQLLANHVFTTKQSRANHDEIDK